MRNCVHSVVGRMNSASTMVVYYIGKPSYHSTGRTRSSSRGTTPIQDEESCSKHCLVAWNRCRFRDEGERLPRMSSQLQVPCPSSTASVGMANCNTPLGSTIHVDHAGLFLGKQFLVVVDAHSKWLEVVLVASTSSRVTVDTLCSIFATHGLPELLVSNNGSAFTNLVTS